MRSKYSPIARNTLASSSTSSNVSAMGCLGRSKRRSDQYRKRARQQTSLERCRARNFAIELNQAPHPALDFATHRPSARPPDASRSFPHARRSVVATPRSEQQLRDGAEALERTVCIERHDVKPTIVGSEVGSEPPEPRRQLPAIENQQHRRANLVERAVNRHTVGRAAHVRQGERGTREVGAELPAALRPV